LVSCGGSDGSSNNSPTQPPPPSNNPDVFCDAGACEFDAEKKNKCQDVFFDCIDTSPFNEDECVAAAVIICND
jgi:hypothetical protein